MSASELPEDIVRVLRIIEYTGPRSVVEECVARSIQGEKRVPHAQGELVIRAATIGAYPEILQAVGDASLGSTAPWPEDDNGMKAELPDCPLCGARSNMPCIGLDGLRLRSVHKSRSRAAAIERSEAGRRRGHFLIIGKHTGMPIGCLSDPTLDDMTHAQKIDPGVTFREIDADQCPCCKSFEAADTEIVEGEPGNG